MGLTAEELKELMAYIEANNGWNKLFSNHIKGRKTPKYVNFRMDTRTGEIWQIEFSDVVGGGTHDATKVYIFRTEQGYDLKEKVYAWLDEVDPKAPKK